MIGELTMYGKIREDKRGFTLLELIIVIAVIGILATIAISQFVEYHRRWNHSIENQKEYIRSEVRHERTLPIAHA